MMTWCRGVRLIGEEEPDRLSPERLALATKPDRLALVKEDCRRCRI